MAAPSNPPVIASLTTSPLVRVAALAVALGAGVAVVFLAFPALIPGSEATSETPVATAPSSPSPRAAPAVTAAVHAGDEPSDPGTTKAIRSVVAALTADGEVADDGSSHMPRPSASSRIYQGSVDDTSTMTVYAATGAPQAALAAYTKALKAQGFTFSDLKPAKDTTAPDEATDPDQPVVIAKTVRVFVKGDLEALVTVSQGETSALLTVIEGPRRSKS